MATTVKNNSVSIVTVPLVMSLGRDGFLAQLANSMARLLHVDHISLFVFDHAFIPHFMGGTSRGAGTITSKLGQLYENSSYYHHDPNLKWVGKSDREDDAPLLQQLHAKDISNQSYRKNIYEDNRLSDRLSLIDHENQKWFILNFYRDTENGYFSEKEVVTIQENAALIAALVKRHLSFSSVTGWNGETVPALAKLENMVTAMGGKLSRREVEVCARVMRGLTREAVALDLGIKQPTVATFMRRAYSKLNISSLNELFALCLAQSGRPPGEG